MCLCMKLVHFLLDFWYSIVIRSAGCLLVPSIQLAITTLDVTVVAVLATWHYFVNQVPPPWVTPRARWYKFTMLL